MQMRFAAGGNPVSPSKSMAHHRSTSSQPSSPSSGQPQLSPTLKGSTQVLAHSRAAKAENPAEDLVPEGPRVISGMLEGIQTDFQSLVSCAHCTSQSEHHCCMSVLDACMYMIRL